MAGDKSFKEAGLVSHDQTIPFFCLLEVLK